MSASKYTIKQIKTWITDKRINAKCGECQKENRFLHREVIDIKDCHDHSFIPTAIIACRHCGHMAMFSVNILSGE